MKVRCVICAWDGDVEHLAVRCGACHAASTLRPVAPVGSLKPGEPICGPASVPVRRESVPLMLAAAERAFALLRAPKPAKKRKSPPRRAQEQVARVAPRDQSF